MKKILASLLSLTMLCTSIGIYSYADGGSPSPSPSPTDPSSTNVTVPGENVTAPSENVTAPSEGTGTGESTGTGEGTGAGKEAEDDGSSNGEKKGLLNFLKSFCYNNKKIVIASCAATLVVIFRNVIKECAQAIAKSVKNVFVKNKTA